jgi:hypothetical protein
MIVSNFQLMLLYFVDEVQESSIESLESNCENFACTPDSGNNYMLGKIRYFIFETK